MSTGIAIPDEPVFVYFRNGNGVNEIAEFAEMMSRWYGPAEAAGLVEARCIGGKTLVFIAARCEEFGRFMDHRPDWTRVRPAA